MPECPRCGGTGKVTRYDACPVCRGNGEVSEEYHYNWFDGHPPTEEDLDRGEEPD